MKNSNNYWLIIVVLAIITCNFLTVGKINAQTVPSPQNLTLPYSQNFSTLNYTSTTYTGGVQGWKIGASSGTTFKTSAPLSNLSLIAKSSASTNSGGIHNFGQKLGFLASGSVDPSIMMNVKTKGFKDIIIDYDIMTIRNPYDGTANTRINEVELQYRIGYTIGTFISCNGKVYSNNTTLKTSAGDTTAQNIQTIKISLPISCDNIDNLQLRWVQRDVSGGGARPSFAIDNIKVDGTPLPSYYRSKQSGNWNQLSTWEVSPDNINFTNATEIPDYKSSGILIQIGHNITLSSSKTVDQLIVDGTLIYGNNVGSILTINDGLGVDFIINGTFEDNAPVNVEWLGNSCWEMGVNGTMIRTRSTSSNNWRDKYNVDILNIPATSNWIVRKTGGDNPSITSTGGMYYPNLTIENTSGIEWITTVGSTFTGSTDYPRIKGDFNVGGNAIGNISVDFLDDNSYMRAVFIGGDMYVREGCTVRNYGTGFEIQGNLTVDGEIVYSTLYENECNLGFTGSNPQTISGKGTINIRNMFISKTANSVTLNKSLTIDNYLLLTKGNINTTIDNILIINVEGATSSGSKYSFVNGPVKKIGNTSFMFPLGKNYNYQPLTISAPQNIKDVFVAEYFQESSENIGTEKADDIFELSTCEYWTLKQTSGISKVSIRLGWNNQSCNSSQPSEMVVAGWNGTKWLNKGNTAYEGTSVIGNVWSKVANNFNSYTLAKQCVLSANAGNDATITLGESTQIGDIPIAGNSYIWTPIEGLSDAKTANPIVTPTDITKYYLTVTNENGCVAIDSITVNITIPNTKLNTESCGANNLSICSYITAEPIFAANTYEFNFENTITKENMKILSSSNKLELSNLTGFIESNTSYNISVRANTNKLEGNYNDVCLVKTGNSELSFIPDTIWNYTLDTNSVLFANKICGANKYNFNMYNEETGVSLNHISDNNQINFSEVSGILDNSSYIIRVKVLIGKTWSEYGNEAFIHFNFNKETYCGTDYLFYDMINNNSNLMNTFKNNLNRIKEKLIKDDNSKNVLDCGNNYITIPIVVHVIYDPNISEGYIGVSNDVIIEQLEKLNVDFNGPHLNSITKENMCINFCLAKILPDGSTNWQKYNSNMEGITRTANVDLAYDNQDLLFINNPADDFLTENYLNLFIVENISVNYYDGSVQYPSGYTTYPQYDSNKGIVVRKKFVGGNFTTVTHEVGHFLGLLHPWGMSANTCQNINDCTSEYPYTNSNDFICDTPPLKHQNNTCIKTNQCIEANDKKDMIENYMDYTPADCQNTFTNGQKLWMHECINFFWRRKNLVSMNNLIKTGIVTVENTGCHELDLSSDFFVNTTQACSENSSTSATPVTFYTNLSSEFNYQKWTYTFTNGISTFTRSNAIDYDSEAKVTVTFPSSGIWSVSLTVMDNKFSPNQVTTLRENLVYVDDCNEIKNQNAQWYFGMNAALDFRNGFAKPASPSMIQAEDRCSNICDNNGDLLFYTDGNTIWNYEHKIITDQLLTGNINYWNNQGVTIIPDPKNKLFGTEKYYVFTVSLIPNDNSTGTLYYSLIDMSEGTNGGSILELNIPINTNNPKVAQNIIAIPHKNGNDYWILVHGIESDYKDVIFAYLITENGIETVSQNGNSLPIFNKFNENAYNQEYNYNQGYHFEVSKDGSKFLMSNYYYNTINIFYFNRNSGALFEFENVFLKENVTQTCLSPSGNFLYASSEFGITQYDLRNIHICDSYIPSSTISFPIDDFYPYNLTLELGPDDKIYIGSINYDYKALDNTLVSIINYPEIACTNINPNACGVNINVIKLLPNQYITGSFPNLINIPIQSVIDNFDFCVKCNIASFNAISCGNSFQWDFNYDGINFHSMSNDENPQHAYSNAGIYNVALIIDGKQPIVKTIEINIPILNTLGTNLTCYNSNDGKINLTVNGGTIPYSFSWSNNEITEDLANLSAGTYTVTAIDVNGCSQTTANTVYSPDKVTVDAVTINPLCGTESGIITASANNGIGNLVYSIDGAIFQESNVFSGLKTGFYTIIVKDMNSCTASTNATVSIPNLISVSSLISPPLCITGTGSITINAFGGTGMFTYSSDGIIFQESNIFTNLNVGIYNITVKDENNCLFTSNNITLTNSLSNPYADFSLADKYENCEEQNTTFINNSTNATKYYWNFGETQANYANTSSLPSPTHIFPTPGYYHIKLTANNACGSSTMEKDIFILPSRIDYNANCCIKDYSYDYEDDILINSGDVWPNKPDVTVKGVITIEPDAILTLNNITVRFGPNGKIIIKPRGQLIINSSTLTSIDYQCNAGTPMRMMWNGIEVWGVTGSAIESEQGKLTTNNSTIEDAYTAVMISSPKLKWEPTFKKFGLEENGSGGIVISNSTTYNRCFYGIRYMSGSYIPNNSEIKNSFFICKTNDVNSTLLDPYLYTETINEYYRIRNPHIIKGPANFTDTWTKPFFHIFAQNIVGVKLIDNYFETSKMGVGLWNSSFRITNNGTNSLGNYFTDCNTAIESSKYQSSIQGNFIQKNRFIKPRVGVLLNTSSNENVKNNEFENNLQGIIIARTTNSSINDNNFSNASVTGLDCVDNSYISNTASIIGFEKEGNSFTKCSRNIVFQGNNSSLKVKCNNFDNSNEEKYLLNWENYGTLANQGLYTTTDPKLPAGNNFNKNDPSKNKEIKTVSAFKYYHHEGANNDNEFRPIPIGAVEVQETNVPFPTNNADIILACSEGTEALTPPLKNITLINQYDQQLDNLQTDYDNLTSNLYDGETTIAKSLSSNTDKSKNSPKAQGNSDKYIKILINNSPLSDNVLIGFIENSSNVAPGLFKDVIIPNSPVSDNVISYLKAKIPSLPSGIAKQIMDAQMYNTGYKTQTSIMREINYYGQNRQILLNNVIQYYVFNNKIDSALYFIENDTTLIAQQNTVGTYIQLGRLSDARNKLNTMPLENESDVAFYELYNLYISLEDSGKTIFDLDSVQLQLVRNIASLCPASTATFQAQVVLQMLFNEEFSNCPENVAKSKQITLSMPEELKNEIVYLGQNYPNPFDTETEIICRIPENMQGGYLVITDITGKRLKEYSVNTGLNKISVLLNDFRSGVYHYSLIMDDRIIDTKQMILIK